MRTRGVARTTSCAIAAVLLAFARPDTAAAASMDMGEWQLLPSLPGVQGPACVARIEGPDLNTSLLLNRDGEPVLILGRSD